MADEPVVVSKAQPMKAGNGVEGKTKPTVSNKSDRINLGQKSILIAKGGSKYQAYRQHTLLIQKFTSALTKADNLQGSNRSGTTQTKGWTS